DAAAGHLLEGVADHLGHRFVALGSKGAQKEREYEGVGKFRRASDPSVDAVIGAGQRARGYDRQVGTQIPGGCLVLGKGSERLGELFDVVLNLVRATLVRICDPRQKAA